jgi:hypothetical protein
MRTFSKIYDLQRELGDYVRVKFGCSAKPDINQVPFPPGLGWAGRYHRRWRLANDGPAAGWQRASVPQALCRGGEGVPASMECLCA